MAHLAWTFILLWLPATAGQAQPIEYRFWAGNIPPYSYVDQEQNARGDLLLVFQTLIERMGYRDKVEIAPWKRVLKETEKNHPMLFIPVTRSPGREKLYQWIEPLTTESFGILSLVGLEREIQDRESIRWLRLCMLRGSVTEELVRRHQLMRVHVVSTHDTCARLLKAGRVDAWLSGKRSALAAFTEVGYDLKDLSVGIQLEQWPIYLAASLAMPEVELQRWRNELQKMKMDGSFDRLLQ